MRLCLYCGYIEVNPGCSRTGYREQETGYSFSWYPGERWNNCVELGYIEGDFWNIVGDLWNIVGDFWNLADSGSGTRGVWNMFLGVSMK